MIVTPQSNLQIMRGIPWTNDYKHTRYFSGGLSDQNSYMQEHVVASFNDFTYVREQNIVRVPMLADNLYNCNYLRYMNSGFGSKWFYAFITDIKFVNAEATEISFEIDYFQTWWFNVQMGHCYVEREHVADDTIGRHVVEENVGTGELCVKSVWRRYWDDDAGGFKVAMITKPTLLGDLLTDQNPIELDENQLHGATYTVGVDNQGVSDLNSWLLSTSFTGMEISDAYMYPAEFTEDSTPIVVEPQKKGIERPTFYIDYTRALSDPNRFYYPKNNKLFTYPYTKLLVVSTAGTKKEYKWENTKEGYVTFELRHNVYNKACCDMRPTNYYGNYDDMIDSVPINEFPKVSLSQYEGLNAKNIFNAVNGLISGIIKFKVNPSESKQLNSGGFGESVINLATDSGTREVNTSGDNLNLNFSTFGYEFYVLGITAQNAKILDDYLTRFGYRVDTIKIPELHSRKRWNYVKTKECEIHARDGLGAPTEALQRIQDMFNAGVTLWHVNDVGDFDGDNGIRS